MKLLFDTHLILWAAAEPNRLSAAARKLFNNLENELVFSAASIWEIVIKKGLARKDFHVDTRLLRQGLLHAGYTELPITGNHAQAVESLPAIHKDPFDRILIAQAIAEGITLVTKDAVIAKYPASVRKV